MQKLSRAVRGLACLAPGLLVAPASAHDVHSHAADAQEAPASVESAEESERQDRIDRLEEQLQVVAEELDSFRKSVAVPEAGELESQYGFGPAASKVYQKERGLSIGSYGEVRLRAGVADSMGQSNVFDLVRAVLYAGYKYDEWFVVNGEFEFEHAGTGGGGSVSVEFLNIDVFLHEIVNLRAGLVLIPMGFINEIHEPVFYYGVERPEPERLILPSTWREAGAGIFGNLGDRVSYRTYFVNGFDATGINKGGNGMRSARQKGSRAKADHFAFVFRTDVEVGWGVDVGGSVYTGRSGQNQSFTRTIGMAPVVFEIPDTPLTIWELHGQYRGYGASARVFYAMAHIGDSFELSNALGRTVASRMFGGYVEVGYDLFSWLLPDSRMSFEPFYRFERFDTQDRVSSGLVRDRSRDVRAHVVGIHFRPHPNISVKLDYRNFEPAQGKRTDEVQFGVGYVF